MDQDGMLFYFVRHVDLAYLDVAYFWTLISALLLLVLNILFGSHKNFDVFMAKPTEKGRMNPILLWIVVVTCSALLNIYFFVKMDYSLPLLDLPENVTELLLRRIEVKERLNPILFNINATVLGPFSLILSLFFLPRYKRLAVLVSALNFLMIGTFSLAKSAFIIGVVVVVLAYSFVKPLRKRTLLKVGALFVILLVPMFIITKSKQAPHVQGQAVAEIVMARIIYGQWAALPFFFEMFENDKQSIALLAPPYFSDGSAWARNGEEVPPRKVMRAVTGYRVLEGTGSGVAVTYFIGEAFAVGGRAGILVGCFWVALQISIMTYLFRGLKKTPLTIYLYSWFIYKICMGLITGISAFILSSFTVILFATFLMTIFGQLGRVCLDRNVASLPITPPRLANVKGG